MILAIDIGNTRIKAAVFEGDILLELIIFLKDDLQKSMRNILKTNKKIEHLVVSSVSDVDKQCFSDFDNLLKVHFISHKDPFPFQNTYKTPQTLGIDRMVLAAGATLHYPNQNRLVIDAGTCVTYDFIDENNNYLGGAIAPGLRLRYESLHNYTAKLPLLKLENPENFIGKSTLESIHSGVVNGLAYEIDGFINAYKEQYLNFIIILTGGDTEFLANRLKNTIFANSNFLLESLNRTFQYKIKND
jgi:type III pantothenate kinase